jgi:RNA polymerase sigma factor (TIGR02999 family)
MNSTSHDVTPLLQEVSKGDEDALARLMPLVYKQLKRLAAHFMNAERSDHTLQPTALVHEAYLLLVRQKVEWQSKAHFFAVAAQLMRRILLDHAKARVRKKRGGLQNKVSLDEVYLFTEDRSDELIALDRSLTKLAKLDLRQSRTSHKAITISQPCSKPSSRGSRRLSSPRKRTGFSLLRRNWAVCRGQPIASMMRIRKPHPPLESRTSVRTA